MNVKLQGLLNAARWVDQTYGPATLTDVRARCSPAVCERLDSGIANTWHPFAEFVEFLTATEEALGHRDGRIAEQIGIAAARANLPQALVRMATYIARPEFLMRRIAGLWRQYNDEGEMRVLTFTERGAEIELLGLSTSSWLFCCTLTGWSIEMARTVGFASVMCKHAQCRGRGGARCLWRVQWATNHP